MLEHWEKILGAVAGISTVVFGVYKRFSHESRRDKASAQQSPEPCKFGAENRQRTTELQIKAGVSESEIAEMQKQLDEVFSRMKEVEYKINWISGFLEQKLK